MSTPSGHAVFLSYASQDAEAAKRICEALRGAGIVVWFDQSELVGGDAWDAKIRLQIAECGLFVPIISTNTQARREGYFRIEWRLAAQRTHAMSDDTAFLLPVVIDDTRDADARVPAEFKAVQWTRLPLRQAQDLRPGGAGAERFCERVKKLLGGAEVAPASPFDGLRALSPSKGSRPSASDAGCSAGQQNALPRRRVPGAVWTVTGIAVLAAVTLVWQWLRHPAAEPPGKPRQAAAATSHPAAPVSEARQLVAKARGLFFQLDETKEDYKIAEGLLKQATAKEGGDAEVWAAYAQLHQRYRARGWDMSDERREEARAATQRALRLDPRSFEARFAQTGFAIGSGREAEEREVALRDLLQERPDDQRVLRALGSLLRGLPGRRDEAIQLYERSAALPGGDPLALYNKALSLWFDGRATEAEAALHAAILQKPFIGARLVEMYFAMSLRGDLDRANGLLDRLPSAELVEDRGCFFAYLLHRYRGKPEAALAVVRAFSRDWIDDNWFRGPRALLVGDALAQAGRPEAATVEWRAALKVVDARLAASPNDLTGLGNRLIVLALLGETAAARKLLPTVRQLVRADVPAGLVPTWFTRACVELGDRPEALRQIALARKATPAGSNRSISIAARSGWSRFTRSRGRSWRNRISSSRDLGA